MQVTLEHSTMRVTVSPAYGARVTGLIDKATGRNWIAPGGESPSTGEDAVYLRDEAVGWDECFPTVAPWDASGTVWGRTLRDHGDLWGRPWQIDAQTATSLTTTFATSEFRFTRGLSLDGDTLAARYVVENRGSVPLPFMWALHGLLAVTPDDRIVLPGVDRVAASYFSHRSKTIIAPTVAWPGPNDELPLALDTIRPAAEHFAAKLYASNLPEPRVSVGSDNAWLDIRWKDTEIAHLGLWLNYGGWPAKGNVHHIALEPTTAPVDHLGQAIETGTATTLAPSVTKNWSVTLTLRHPKTPGTP